MKCAKEAGWEIVAVVAGRDADIVARERNLEWVDSTVKAAAREIVAKLSGYLKGELFLQVFREVPAEEVVRVLRSCSDCTQERNDACPEIGEERLQCRNSLSGFEERHQCVVRVLRVADGIRKTARQVYSLLKIWGEEVVPVLLARLYPCRLRG